MPIVVKDLRFAYEGRAVMSGATATFDEGLVHVVLGRTGSGKTTLALILAGLLKPQGGSVSIDGNDPQSDRFDRSQLQLAFQFPEAQMFETTVAREIEYGLRNFGLSPEAIPARRDWACGCVGLPRNLLDKDPARLSFGERRKVALASVIAVRPKYLILDEPLAGLDWTGRRSLLDTLALIKADGLTVLVFTHESDILAEVGDAALVVEGGRLAGPLRPEDFLYPAGGASDMVPEYARVLTGLAAAGFPIAARPRGVHDAARTISEALT